MGKTVKHSAGGIVLDLKTEKILLTKKLSKYEYKANVIKSLLSLLHMQPETVIKKFKGGFTKGKIKKDHSKAWTACKEIEEEGGVDSRDFIYEKNLGAFTKQKKYGLKEVEMYLYTLHQRYSELQPSDIRHIAAFIDIAKAPELMQSKEEKEFLLSVQGEIEEILTNYKKIHNMPKEENTTIMPGKKVSLVTMDKDEIQGNL